MKLENIMFESTETSTIKIVDFGIAGISLNMNAENMDMGSIKYMPPEVLTGKVK